MTDKISDLPEGVVSLLDTDLYKLTMQCCVLKYFPDVHVTYRFTNRTPHLKFNRVAFHWLEKQIAKLGNLSLSDSELEFLSSKCPFLTQNYLNYLKNFRLRPSEQIRATFDATKNTGSEQDAGDVTIHTEGLWRETILYEIPLLALISEAYFKFCDTDWDYEGQQEKAQRKGLTLLENSCIFSEFGTRRRRDYRTQDIVLQGLMKAQEKATANGWAGKLSGTSNVHFAHRYNLAPVGTVAHEWFMGVAAITNNYENASEIALRYWVGTFGEGVLGIALTDTFGTPAFLQAFKLPIPKFTAAVQGASATAPSAPDSSSVATVDNISKTKPPIHAPISQSEADDESTKTYAQTFTGVRQDSGDPEEFVIMMRKFYNELGIKEKKTIVFSDSLNIDLCLKYKAAAEKHDFQPTFGVGTFLTNDFVHKSDGGKSVPLNIVIKIATAEGRSAIKISDNIGKNTGDKATVDEVKRRLGYEEKTWSGGDESTRWGKQHEGAK